MESLDTTAAANSYFMEDIFDFSSDIGEEEDDDDIIAGKSNNNNHHLLRNRRQPPFSLLSGTQDFVEEELEWISNKDAFPMVESLVDIMPNHPSIAPSSNNSLNSYQSPISVLENSSGSFNSHGSINNIGGNMNMNLMLVNFKVPGKARSKQGRRRRRDLLGHQFLCWSVHGKPAKKHGSVSKSSSTIGRKCLHCGSEKTPQWRAGPLGPKTLCNACGVRYKSGRLCDEYRPASSPTFSSELHSNSHRKIVEMRKQKVPGGSILKPEIS